MLAEVQARHSTLYVTGEESLTQVHLRAKRLGLTRLDLPVLAETGVEQIIAQLQAVQPALVVIDSIQTLYTDTPDSAPGSVSQLRHCSVQLVRFAESSHPDAVLVVPRPKEGGIAGP